jgi:hypothetical protein
MYSMYIEYCTDIKGPRADIAIIEKVKEKRWPMPLLIVFLPAVVHWPLPCYPSRLDIRSTSLYSLVCDFVHLFYSLLSLYPAYTVLYSYTCSLAFCLFVVCFFSFLL